MSVYTPYEQNMVCLCIFISWHIKPWELFNANMTLLEIKSIVGDGSRRRPEGSLFNSYYTEV